MDLFTPLVTENKLHPLFKRIRSEKSYEPTIKVINGWSEGLLGRKKEVKKFIIEFQTTFNSSLWELYLNKSFIDLGFKIDYSKESPDFHLIHSTGKLINIEAVTANSELNQNDEYYSSSSLKKSAKISRDDFLNQSAIKLIGKIKDKRDLFTGKDNKKHPYSSLMHVNGNPFVVAIAPFDNLLSYNQNNIAINIVLYGIMKNKNISHILNRNGKKIDVGIFTNDSYKEISAVIFSTTGMFGKAVVQAGSSSFIQATKYREFKLSEFIEKEGINKLGRSHTQLNNKSEVYSLRLQLGNVVFGSDTYLYDSSHHTETHLDGLHIYYNPFAQIPLNKNFFSAHELTQNDYDIQSGQMICKHNDGSLVSRQTFTLFT